MEIYEHKYSDIDHIREHAHGAPRPKQHLGDIDEPTCKEKCRQGKKPRVGNHYVLVGGMLLADIEQKKHKNVDKQPKCGYGYAQKLAIFGSVYYIAADSFTHLAKACGRVVDELHVMDSQK